MKIHDLSLATRITIGVLSIVIVGTVALVISENSRLQEAYLSERRTHLKNDLEAEKLRLNEAINILRQDTLFLSNTPPISGIIRAKLNGGYDAQDGDTDKRWKKRLLGIFAAFSVAHPEYYRLRFISATGEWKELARVDHLHGHIDFKSTETALTMQERGSFKDAMLLNQEQVGLSDIGLSREVDTPIRTLRAVTPAYTRTGKKFGLLEVSMDVDRLLGAAASDLPGIQTYISDNKGRYLLHPESRRQFDFQSDGKNEIATDFPFIATMFQPESLDLHPLQSVEDKPSSSFFAANRIRFDPNDPSHSLLLMYYLPGEAVAAQVATIPLDAIRNEFIVMLLIGGLATLVLRRSLSPLKQITVAANRITAGEQDVLLPLTEGGEIGSVTNALNTMLTKLSQREVLLRESESRYRRLHESMREAFVMVDMSGRLLDFNHAYQEMLGYSPDELLRLSYIDLTPAKWHEREAQIVKDQVLPHGYSQVFEKEYIRKDGTVFPVELKAFLLRGKSGYPEAMWAIVRNITERKENERKQMQLTEQIRRYADDISDIYEHAPCGYHSLDKDGRILHINATELKWLGYTRDEIVGKLTLQHLLTPATLPNFEKTFPLFKKTGEIRDVELELVCKDGSIFPVLISATAVYDAQGNFVMSRSTVYDMTERKKMERERVVYLNRLEEISRHLVTAQEDARRRLSSELHDRTSPNLAAIALNLDMIAKKLAQENNMDISERLEDTQALITDTTASIRDICADMRPPLLDYAGLVAAIESYALQFIPGSW